MLLVINKKYCLNILGNIIIEINLPLLEYIITVYAIRNHRTSLPCI